MTTHLTGPPTGRDAIVVGAGFAGLYALHKLRDEHGLDAVLIEAGGDVGGVWYHNRYPGARCDIESLDYSYSFDEDLAREWTWTERYAGQPEILAYLRHVADRFDLRRDIRLHTTVTAAAFDEATSRWSVTTDAGVELSTRYLVMATGVLSVPLEPTTPGLDTFAGTWVHSGNWPHEGLDVRGKRVAVIGTGSSGVQMIPLLAEQADELVVLQRTPNFAVPAHNGPLTEETVADWRSDLRGRRAFARTTFFGHNQPTNPRPGADYPAEQRREVLAHRWSLGGLHMMRSFGDLLTDEAVNEESSQFVRDRIRETVADEETAEALLPRGIPFGTKRLCSGTGYYETFNRPDVRLVDLRRHPLERVTGTGLRLGGGPEDTGTGIDIEVDVIVFATGFDAMTGALHRIDPVGRGGVRLTGHWDAGPRTHLGVSVHGFPNMFVVAGPGSPSVFSNMVCSIEQHVEWISDAIGHLERLGGAVMEPTADAERDWVAHVNDVAANTLFARSPNTWYHGANVPGKPRVFLPYLGGVHRYGELLAEVAADDYRGHTIDPPAGNAPPTPLTDGAPSPSTPSTERTPA